jgi:hypothetical protein
MPKSDRMLPDLMGRAEAKTRHVPFITSCSLILLYWKKAARVHILSQNL